MQTLDAVQQRFEGRTNSNDDPFGFGADALAEFLPTLNPQAPSITEKNVITVMEDYMGFAWDKAICHRGISASRSVSKMASWLWILGDTELHAFATNNAKYRNYGVPILRKISQKYNFEIPEEAQNWKDGEPCRPDCDEGCSR